MVTKKDLVIVVLVIFCLTATLFLIIPTRSSPNGYDPRLDVNGDGVINIKDIAMVAIAFGTSGTPINWTEIAGIITDLQNQVNDLNNTLNLAKSTVWIQNTTGWPEGGHQFSAPYCGYIKVDITPTIDGWIPPIPITVRVMYDTLGVAYDDNQTMYTAGRAFFPILPCSSILVMIFTMTGQLPGWESVTITYYY